MKKEHFDLVVNTLLQNEQQAINSAISRLSKIYDNVITDNDNYVYAIGSNPICLVAHVDTLRRKEEVTLLTDGNRIINKHGILGADDLAGVAAIFIILELLAESGCNNYPSVLFTNKEEVMGIGVKRFISDRVFEPDTVKLFVELDRAGSDQYVYYSQDFPPEVEAYIESFGFIVGCGSYSDVADLSDAYLIPHVNVSIGYYRQHTNKEFLMIDCLELAINRVLDIVKNPIENLYKLKSKRFTPTIGSYMCENFDDIIDLTPGDFPLDEYDFTKTKYATLSDFLSVYTVYSLCPECGLDWYQCGCGEIFWKMLEFFTNEQLIEIEASMNCSDLQKDLNDYLKER